MYASLHPNGSIKDIDAGVAKMFWQWTVVSEHVAKKLWLERKSGMVKLKWRYSKVCSSILYLEKSMLDIYKWGRDALCRMSMMEEHAGSMFGTTDSMQ